MKTSFAPLRVFLTSWLLFLFVEVTAQDSYTIESIPTPPGLHPVNGALAFLPDGRLTACFLRGEVMIYTPAKKQWSLFAQGLQEPLGMLVVSDSEMVVMQRPELTRIKDTDGDGVADLYETVSDDFGSTGNYHEFNYGPVKDASGNLFFGLNTASSNGNIRSEVRGRLDTLTLNQRGQMFSAVPYRGWIMKIDANGKQSPFASGLRSPNGMGFDLQGNLFVSENQGDWVGTSALYHLQQGRFYGHPASLVWQENWKRGSPYNLPLAELDSMRTRASVLFPHGIIANSPTQPLCDITKGKFGPFAGQFFVGEMNTERILRVMLEKIDGEYQGACIPFFNGHGLRKGNNRLAFAPDGSLWTGQARQQAWAGDEGIQRISYSGKAPVDILFMHLAKNGFNLDFTQPMDKAALNNLSNYRLRRYHYEYHKKYGSDQFDLADVPVSSLQVSADGKRVSLQLPTLEVGFIYELTLNNMRAVQGTRLENNLICYTLNRLLK